MTKIYLPTELGIKGEGTTTGIEDTARPDAKEVLANQDPAVSEQPEFYKGVVDTSKGLTLAEQRTGKENTVNQSLKLDSEAPEELKEDKSVKVGELAKNKSSSS